MERKWWTLLAVCLATFMLLLDITIVNVALPDISEELGASFSEVQWVIDAYALTLAALLLTAGSLADMLGRRLVFAVGLVCFTVASLLCALAPSATTLILARGAQGIGGAAMFATSLALLAEEFHGAERGTAFGLWGATTGAAVAIGPLVGGALTDALGWPSIFYLNLPIGIATLAIALRKLPESRDEQAAAIDWLGLTTFSAALFLLVYGLIQGNEHGWDSGVIVGSLVTAALLLVLFIVVERSQARPMFDLALLRKPTFGGFVDRRVRAVGIDVRDVPLPRPVHADDPRVRAARDGAALPAGDGAVVRRRHGVREAHGAAARPRSARRRLLLVAAGLLLMRGLDAERRLDGAAARLRRRGSRDRHDQPIDREHRDRRGRTCAGGHGVWHQLDVSPGRHRDRHRGPRRGLPEPGHAAVWRPRSPAPPPPRRRATSAAR